MLKEEDLFWNHFFFPKKEATFFSETRQRQYACLEKLSTGTASSLLSKFVLMKIEAVVIAHINIPNGFPLRMCFCCFAPEAKVPALMWVFGGAICAWESLRNSEEDARVLWGRSESLQGYPEKDRKGGWEDRGRMRE